MVTRENGFVGTNRTDILNSQIDKIKEVTRVTFNEPLIRFWRHERPRNVGSLDSGNTDVGTGLVGASRMM